MKKSLITLAVALSITMAGCGGGSSNYDFTTVPQFSTTLSSIFDPSAGKVPRINDLLFVGSTDGTLNIPLASLSTGEQGLASMLNTLDGFGLTTPVSADFSTNIDPNSLILGQTVRVFEVTTGAGGAVTGVTAELASGDALVALDPTGMSVVVVPLKPLKESTTYMVILTNGIKDTNGKNSGTASAYLLAKSGTPLTGTTAALEPLRQLVNTQLAVAGGEGINPNDVILSWTFTTQSVTPVLNQVKTLATQKTAAIAQIPGATSPLGKANLYMGTLEVPYYLDDANPLQSFWTGVGNSFLTRYNAVPQSKSTQTIPVLMTKPNASSAFGASPPSGGWPVVIFQHGITRNRTDMLGVADTLADAGFVVIAIDLPLHGITSTANDDPAVSALLTALQASNTPFPGDRERTFDLDLDGVSGIDPSGSYFINLSSPITSRDNIRQAISDLLILRKSLGNIASGAGFSLNTSKVGFVGHSLGSIVGTGYLSVESELTPATLAVPGGGIAKLLDASESFGPAIHSGLANAGLQQGTAAYEAYMVTTQTLIDPADPVVLGKTAVANQPVHLIEVLGDTVIPNSVAGAPLSGTEPLIRVSGLPIVTGSVGDASDIDGAVRFLEGVHGSIIDPSASLAATTEMQTETAAFQLSVGTQIPIVNSSVISVEP